MPRLETVTVPDIGNFDKVDVIDILVAPGDTVAAEQSLISLESDKATMDVPSPFAGKVKDIAVKNGAKVGKGDVILTLEVEEGAAELTGASPATGTSSTPAASPSPPNGGEGRGEGTAGRTPSARPLPPNPTPAGGRAPAPPPLSPGG
jgi:pyruvate/2-oxoglutarate dehydrogenase complex dihydrolipoamide acyltransferase (E2) component